MLLNNFFTITAIQKTEQQITTSIAINCDHEILKGHFPQQAVVPGVCMVEMLKEVLQENLNQKLRMKSSSMIKFLTMFTPPEISTANFIITIKTVEENQFQIDANLSLEEKIFMKFKGIFVAI